MTGTTEPPPRSRGGDPADAARFREVAASFAHWGRCEPRDGASPEERLRAGDRIEDFELIELLGQGGMGCVWSARDVVSGGRPVALKLRASVLADVDRAKRWRSEVASLYRVRHPNLVEIIRSAEVPGWLFIAMRLVPGRTLHETIVEQRGAATREGRQRAVAWVAQIAEALRAVHDEQHVHRDVKPRNIIIEQATSRPVLVDFGLARPLDPETRSSVIVATKPYASPEQLDGGATDACSDVYSLGVTLHDALTGRLPDGSVVLRAGVQDPVPRLRALEPDFDRGLDAIVERATEKDPADRYRDMREFRADLEAWLKHRTVAARWRQLPARARRAMTPRRLLRAGVTLALSIGLFVIGGLAAAWNDVGSGLRRAAAQGDLLAFAEGAEELPAWVARLVLTPAQSSWTVRLRAAEPGDSLVDTAAALRDRDRDGARLRAASALRVQGLAAEPLLTRFLTAELCEGSSPSHSTLRGRALRTIARLFLDRPPGSATEASACVPLADGLRSVLSSHPDADEELQAWTALSGCGTRVDALRAADEAARLLALSGFDEHVRVRLGVVERIVRREHEFGTTDPAMLHAIVDMLGPIVREVHACNARNAASQSSVEVTERLASALVLAARDAGRGLDVDGLVPASDLLVTEEGGWTITRSGWLGAATGDPAAFEELFAQPAAERLIHPTDRWAWACGVLGNPDCTKRLRELVPPGRLQAFEDWRLAGEQARDGCVDELLPDPDTLLGVPASLETWQPSVRARGWNAEEAESFGPAPEVTRTRAKLDPRFLGAATPVAVWDFRGAVIEVAGSARGPGGHAVRIDQEGGDNTYLRFGQPGQSTVRLEFDVRQETLGAVWQVVLLAQKGSRFYLPYKGDALFEVQLDGGPVAVTPIVAVEPTNVPVPLAPDRLGLGRHVIVIRLGTASNTTCRLQRVEVCEPQVPP